MPNVLGEWMHPDAASAVEVMHTALNCPSGAIRVSRNDGSATSDSPPVVNTAITLFLCRCRQSTTTLYCDSSHKAAGFQAE